MNMLSNLIDSIDNIVRRLDIDNIVKKIDIGEYTYILGYDEWEKQIYPKMEIYIGNELVATGERDYDGSFYFDSGETYPDYWRNVDTVQEMFMGLKEHMEIPEEVERKFEEIYLLYKLNDFRKI